MAFKVVLNNGYGLYSLVDTGIHRIRYEPMKWIGSIHPIFVFKELSDTRDFIRKIIHLGRFEIWYCNVRKMRPMEVVSKSHYNIDEFWSKSYWMNGWKSPEVTSAPKGTYVVDRIMLKEPVPYDGKND